MIIESSRFHSGKYEKRNITGPILEEDIERIAEKYKGQPVLIWVGGGFLEFIKEEIDPEQNRHMLQGILSGSLGQNLVLDPWFRSEDMEKISKEFIFKFVLGADSEELSKSWRREKAISSSKYGLVIPVSEISMMGRNPDMIEY